MELSLHTGETRAYPINDAVTGGYPYGKTEIGFLISSFYYTENQFQVIKDSDMKSKTIKLLEEDVGDL